MRSFGLRVRRPLVPSLAWVALAVSLVGVSCAGSPLGVKTPAGPGHGLTPAQTLAQGEAALAQGDLAAGLPLLREAERAGAREGTPAVRYPALIGLARGLSSLGEYAEAEEALAEALALAGELGDPARETRARVALGGVELAQGEEVSARANLEEAAAEAKNLGLPALEAAALNDLGNLEMLSGEAAAAAVFYQRARQAAQGAGDFGLVARAEANTARALGGNATESLAAAARAEQALARAGPTAPRAALLLNLGLGVEEMIALHPDRARALEARAAGLLEAAEAVARAQGNARVLAYALAARGGLAADTGDLAGGLSLTREALDGARLLDAPELVYRWQAQWARLLAATGDRSGAIAGYRKALLSLQALRDQASWGAGLASSSFDDRVAPVYRQLLELLLDEAATSPDPEQSQRWLVEARSTMESFKAAELRDYFRDDCVDAQQARTRGLESVSPHAAILYPILLRDQTALLISTPGEPLELVFVPVSREALEAEAKTLRAQLERQATRRYLVSARRLYDWLIRPIEARLEASGVSTLVFVPDGALLTIPMAALHNGERFLIEDYAVATTPGFDLVDPAPLDPEGIQALLAGLSESVQGEAPLPEVAEELRAVEALVGGQILLNEEFQRAELRNSLEANNFGIVHIATHAQFSPRPDETFLLAWDGRLSLDELSEDVGLFRFREEPLGLLTLSACETARGGEKAGLGLSGMAVKAGARSVLGSLWSVNDPAATVLVENFYARLVAGDSRAQALRAAQLALLADFRYRHPAYWAPFLLIGTWL